MQIMPTLLLRFDIDKIDYGFYGAKCYEILFNSIPAPMLDGIWFYDGDSRATLNGNEYVYVIALQSQSPASLAIILKQIEHNESFNAVSANNPTILCPDGSSEPLVLSGLMRNGVLSGENSPAHLAMRSMKAAVDKQKEEPPTEKRIEIEDAKKPAPESVKVQVLEDAQAKVEAPEQYPPQAAAQYAPYPYIQPPQKAKVKVPYTLFSIGLVCALLWSFFLPVFIIAFSGNAYLTPALADKVRDDAILVVKLNKKSNSFINAVMSSGDYSKGLDKMKSQLKGKNMEEEVFFNYSFELPDISQLKNTSMPESTSEEMRLNDFSGKLVNLPKKKQYSMGCWLDGGNISWDTEDLNSLIAMIDKDLSTNIYSKSTPSQNEVKKDIPPVPVYTPPETKVVLPYPNTGQLSSYGDSSTFAPLRFNVAEGNPTYIKLYRTSGELVRTLFICSGQSYTTYMPKGSYITKYASGKNWYGEKEMFGDEGTYQKTDTVLEFEASGKGYEITLKNVAGGNLSSSPQKKDGF